MRRRRNIDRQFSEIKRAIAADPENPGSWQQLVSSHQRAGTESELLSLCIKLGKVNEDNVRLAAILGHEGSRKLFLPREWGQDENVWYPYRVAMRRVVHGLAFGTPSPRRPVNNIILGDLEPGDNPAELVKAILWLTKRVSRIFADWVSPRPQFGAAIKNAETWLEDPSPYNAETINEEALRMAGEEWGASYAGRAAKWASVSTGGWLLTKTWFPEEEGYLALTPSIGVASFHYAAKAEYFDALARGKRRRKGHGSAEMPSGETDRDAAQILLEYLLRGCFKPRQLPLLSSALEERRKGVRHCSICGTAGHDRRTCPGRSP